MMSIGNSRNSCRKKYSEEDVKKALLEIERGQLSYPKASEKYRVPISTLFNRMNNLHCKSSGGQTVFSTEEEQSIVEHIQVCGEWGFPLTKQDVQQVAANILKMQNRTVTEFKNNTPGRKWIDHFLKRHKDKISLRLSQNIKRARAEKSKQEIDSYFSNLQKSCEGVPPQNIINYDETNLSDNPGRKQAIFKRGTKYPELVRNYTKSAISIMFAGTASGQLLSTYVVYKSKTLSSSWCRGGPPRTRYNKTESGWFDFICFLDWFKTVLVPYCRKLSGPKVLIGDNLSSHIKLEVIKLCQELDIRFVMLPSNSTHLTQPLDVAFFRPMKQKWRQVLSTFKDNNPSLASLPKEDFPSLLNELVTEISVRGEQNLQSGFRKCGIYPFNPNQVLQSLPGQSPESYKTVSQSFVELLEQKRAPLEKKPRQKRSKLNIEPGASVSFEEIQLLDTNAAVKSKQSKNSTSRKRKEPPASCNENPVRGKKKKEPPANSNKKPAGGKKRKEPPAQSNFRVSARLAARVASKT